MAGVHTPSSSAAFQAPIPRLPSTPPLPPIRHSSSAKTLRHASSLAEPPSTPPNKPRLPPIKTSSSKGKEPTRNRSTNYSSKIERPRATTVSQTDSRHSHGLSWSSATRDSLVDNLLTSLDGLSQLAGRQYDEPPTSDIDWARFDAINAMSSTMPRSRGHTYSSSLSSDRAPDSPASTNFTPVTKKGRRSTSSSNFGIQPSLSQKRPSRSAAGNEKVLTSDKQTLGRAQTSHEREWSNVSSMDQPFLDALEAPPRIGLGGPRSISMDNIRPMSTGQDSILHRGRPVPSVFSRYEAFDSAPEPSVPAGPRKLQNPNASGPVYVNAAPKQSALRKITTQSDLRAVSSPQVPPEMRDRASDFVRSAGMLDGGTTPTVTQSAKRDPNTPHQEKQGFFKRVFGGGSNKNANERSETSHNAADTRAISTASGVPKSTDRQVSADQSITSTASPAVPVPPPPPPTLNKKPSSFFRRRKKSMGDVPPPPPLSLADRMQSDDPNRTSISSLRKVMDQFLTEDPMKSATKTDYSRPTTRASAISDDLDMFHSGYTPPVIDMNRTKSSKSIDTQSNGDSPLTKLKVKKRAQNAPPQTATSQSSVGSGAVDAMLLNQSTLSYVETADVERVSPITELTSMINDDGRVSALGPPEADTTPVITPETEQEMKTFAAGSNVDLNMNGDSWLVPHNKSSTSAADRLVLVPSDDENAAPETTPRRPTIEQTIRNVPPSRDAADPPKAEQVVQQSAPATPAVNEDAECRERARRIYVGDETDIAKLDAASWMGEDKPLNSRTLHEYMQLYDFAQMNILTALRTLCSKLRLRGETQQFDRIITAFSTRWCECNPSHGFKAQDVVHTICYSLILLNTDLHLADIGEKMSRTAYVRNTLPTVKRVVADAAPQAFEAASAGTIRPPIPWTENQDPSSPMLPPDTPQERTSFEGKINIPQRMTSVRPGTNRAESDGWIDSTSSNALVSYSSPGTARSWENEIEAILKSFFTSIRNEPLPLLSLEPMQTDRNLSVGNLGLKRTASIVSKAPSDAHSSRSRGTGLRSLTLGFQARNNRSRQKVFSSNTMSSSRTSFDDNSSLWSPTGSSTWSKNSMGKTLTSTSMNSLAASYMSSGDREFKHSIGFANALSHAIIREEGLGMGNDADSLIIRGDLLEDESLTLEGAPWAKEGMVKHKHHLEAPDRKAKERSWNECFAVISRGKLTLFNFNTEVKTRSLGRPRTKQGSQAPSIAGTRVGGGDWMENAEQLGVFVLRHTISSTLPPPGYSKARPFVWALSLPSGAVHLFQVGTPEIAEEWMTTANYWSARLSKEPLSGGVSNIEYGWSENVVNMAAVEHSDGVSSPPPSIANRSHTHGRTSSTGTTTRQSIHSSIRGSFDVGGANRQRLPGDKIHITEWSPPSQSIMASQLPEGDQLRSLSGYVANVEAELEKHHELKHAIELAYSPRHSNYNKAMTNWQRKSEYLLREIVKFRTYMDSLVAAQKSKDEVYAKRAERAQSKAAGSATLTPAAAQDLRRTTSNVSVSTVSLHASDV